MEFPTLILIDVQTGFADPCWGRRNNPAFEEHTARLLAHWRARAAGIVHVRHCSVEPDSPLRPDRPGVAWMTCAQPQAGEAVFEKSVHAAFIGTDLHAYLCARGARSLVLAGLTTDHCVSTTTRVAADMGYEVRVAAEATATFDRFTPQGERIAAEVVHQVSLASLDREFARVSTTAELLRLQGEKIGSVS